MRTEQTKQSDAQAAMFGSDLLQPLIDKAAELHMQRPSSKLILPIEVLRRMPKAEYKATMRWLRKCRRKIDEKVSTSEFVEAVTSRMCYGY